MRKATVKDRDLVISIISESFDKNPSVNWTVKQDAKRNIRYKKMASFVFKKALRLNAVYLSSDNNGVIVFYKEKERKETLKDVLAQVKIVFGVIGFERVGQILKREKHIKSKRPADGNYLYCWFFGVLKEARGKGASVELKNFIFEEADKLNLPIYIETTIPINMKIYDRYGFKTYYEWKVKNKGLTYWMMRREKKTLS